MTLGKIPWITEGNPWRGLPKTARIPTGGWRGLGAVPSHSYPQPSVLPDGYWQGMGMIASTCHPDAQRAKTTLGFGATTAEEQRLASLKQQLLHANATGNTAGAAHLQAQITSLEPGFDWAKLAEQVLTTGTTAYTAKLTADAQRKALQAGLPLPGIPTAPVGPVPAGAGAGGNTLLYVGGAVVLGFIAFMALR